MPTSTNLQFLMSRFNWYPGHIAKAEKELKEKIKLVDLVIELRDARIPRSSAHPELVSWLKDKQSILVYAKADLADPQKIPKDILCISIKDKNSIKKLRMILEEYSKPIVSKFASKGLINKPCKIMVLGFPNIGKSSLINALASKRKNKVQDKPGITRQIQWLDLSSSIKLMDTPGIIPPKLFSDEQAIKLALCNLIPDSAYEVELVVQEALALFDKIYPNLICDFYNINKLDLEEIAKSQNLLTNLGLDQRRAALRFLEDFRNLKFGKLSLDD